MVFKDINRIITLEAFNISKVILFKIKQQIELESLQEK